MTSNTNLGAYGIMYVIKTKKNEVISLLLKNGVVVPNTATDIQIGLIVTNLVKSSKSFKNDFSKLLLNQDVIDSMSNNMSGSYANAIGDFDFSQYKIDESPIFATTTASTSTSNTATPSTPASNSNFLNKGLSVLQTAFQGYLQLDENKTKRALADASVQITDSSQSNDNVMPPSSGMSTGAIVGLSLLGISIIGAITYFIIKKK